MYRIMQTRKGRKFMDKTSNLDNKKCQGKPFGTREARTSLPLEGDMSASNKANAVKPSEDDCHCDQAKRVEKSQPLQNKNVISTGAEKSQQLKKRYYS